MKFTENSWIRYLKQLCFAKIRNIGKTRENKGQLQLQLFSTLNRLTGERKFSHTHPKNGSPLKVIIEKYASMLIDKDYKEKWIWNLFYILLFDCNFVIKLYILETLRIVSIGSIIFDRPRCCPIIALTAMLWNIYKNQSYISGTRKGNFAASKFGKMSLRLETRLFLDVDVDFPFFRQILFVSSL